MQKTGLESNVGFQPPLHTGALLRISHYKARSAILKIGKLGPKEKVRLHPFSEVRSGGSSYSIHSTHTHTYTWKVSKSKLQKPNQPRYLLALYRISPLSRSNVGDSVEHSLGSQKSRMDSNRYVEVASRSHFHIFRHIASSADQATMYPTWAPA